MFDQILYLRRCDRHRADHLSEHALGAVAGLFVWGFVPGYMVFLGAAIIIVSNFVIIVRESKKKTRPVPEITS